ncbi:MAG: sulfotransferase domain-containing protein [Simkaniaceae bacterium]
MFRKIGCLLLLTIGVFGGYEEAYAQGFLVLTIRKGGSNLLNRCIELLGKPYPYYLHFSSPNVDYLYFHKGLKIISIMRDPRDVVVSLLRITETYFEGKSGAEVDQEMFVWTGRKGVTQGMVDYWNGSTYDEKLLISMDPSWPLIFSGFRWEYDKLKIFSHRSNFCLIRFEDLVGEKGGGSAEAQREAIIQIAAFLEIPLTEEKIRYVVDNLYGTSWTFRKGQVGSWKEHFKPQHVERFVEELGDILIDWGYEKDDSWALNLGWRDAS